MIEQHFNLTTDPWIKVIRQDTSQETKVSLIELFAHAQDYRQLAGEMKSQDLAILRLLLAILTTVYSRFDAEGEAYSWLQLNDDTFQTIDVNPDDDTEESEMADDLLATWTQVYQTGHFSDIVTRYLQRYADRFDFFGDHPFYQVTTQDYDALVPANKQVAKGKGRVAVKQLNRRISESANTPAVFAPKTGELKNQLSVDELIRWIITYQNFTGVTDKTKVVTTEKFSNPAGWLYRLGPVYAQGQTIFETLMLNLVLVGDKLDVTAVQRPVWEFSTVQDYVTERKKQAKPTNLAELYTAWSRILHIEWVDQQPNIFSAGIPMFASEDTLIEPMTTWRWDKKEKQFRPAVKGLRSLGISMWRNFGQYVKVNDEKTERQPGLVDWLQRLKHQENTVIADDQPLTLASVALVSDGNATSQSPAAEVADDLQMQADVLFDPEIEDHWPVRIEDAVEVTQNVGTDFYHFAADIAQIRDIDSRDFAGKWSAQFYASLDAPFKDWLAQLTGHDNREVKINDWKLQLQSLLRQAVQAVLETSSPRDITGIKDSKDRPFNIFTAQSRLNYNVHRHLNLTKKA